MGSLRFNAMKSRGTLAIKHKHEGRQICVGQSRQVCRAVTSQMLERDARSRAVMGALTCVEITFHVYVRIESAFTSTSTFTFTPAYHSCTFWFVSGSSAKGIGEAQPGPPVSHFQVGSRAGRPLEGTSNGSDIAAREFKSLTSRGLPVYPRWRLASVCVGVCMCVYAK